MNAPQTVVHALAVAHAEANVVGAVRLRCRDAHLEIELLRVGRASSGFIFPSVADVARLVVPYSAVRALVRRGPLLHLLLDQSVNSPHRHFALCRFGREETGQLLAALRWRRLATVARVVLPVVALAIGSWAMPESLARGPVGRLAVGAVAALAVWQMMTWVLAALAAPASSRSLAESFESDLTSRMGIAPSKITHGSRRAIAPRRVQVEGPSVGAWLGLQGATARLAIAISAGLVLIGASVFLLQRMGVVDRVLIPTNTLRARFRPSVTRRVAAARLVGTPRGAPCKCERPFFRGWSDGLPRMSVLIAQGRGNIEPIWIPVGETLPVTMPQARVIEPTPEPRPGRRRRKKRRRREKPVTFDLAIVNNSTEPIVALDLVVTFARRDAAGQRHGINESGLHWPRPLRPGEAVKWSVRGFGTEFKVDTRAGQGRLGDGQTVVAPADVFVRLNRARLGVVRVHAAMMLAYLNDPRTADFTRGLMRLSGREQLARQRLLEVAAAIRVCEPTLATDGLSVCVENHSSVLRRELHIIADVAAGAPSTTTKVEDLFLPGSGIRTSIAWNSLELPHAVRARVVTTGARAPTKP